MGRIPRRNVSVLSVKGEAALQSRAIVEPLRRKI